MRKWKISDHSSRGVDSNHVIQTPCCPSYTENTAFTLEDPLSPYFFHCRVNILTKIPENFSCVKKPELLPITWSSEATSGVPPSQLFPPINVALFTTIPYHTNHPTATRRPGLKYGPGGKNGSVWYFVAAAASIVIKDCHVVGTINRTGPSPSNCLFVLDATSSAIVKLWDLFNRVWKLISCLIALIFKMMHSYCLCLKSMRA